MAKSHYQFKKRQKELAKKKKQELKRQRKFDQKNEDSEATPGEPRIADIGPASE